MLGCDGYGELAGRGGGDVVEWGAGGTYGGCRISLQLLEKKATAIYMTRRVRVSVCFCCRAMMRLNAIPSWIFFSPRSWPCSSFRLLILPECRLIKRTLENHFHSPPQSPQPSTGSYSPAPSTHRTYFAAHRQWCRAALVGLEVR